MGRWREVVGPFWARDLMARSGVRYVPGIDRVDPGERVLGMAVFDMDEVVLVLPRGQNPGGLVRLGEAVQAYLTEWIERHMGVERREEPEEV